MLEMMLFSFMVTSSVNVDSLLSVAKEYHNQALAGEKGALKKGEECFKRILKYQPKSGLAHAWYGSLLTIKGRDEEFPFMKMKYVNDGLKHMDRAVELEPDNIEIRWLRAQNNISLPYFFNRLDTAIVDLEFLYNNSLDDKYKVLLWLGRAYKQKGDIEKARECWQNIIEKSSDSLLIDNARTLLKENEE
ncbi:MAG: tetratricopeptide repeat protein [bacterium]